MASANRDASITIWNLANINAIAALVGHEFWVISVSFSQNGRFLVSKSWDQTVKVWDLNFLLGHLGIGSDYSFRIDRIEEVKKLLKRTENQVGFVMDGLTPCDASYYSGLGYEYFEMREYGG